MDRIIQWSAEVFSFFLQQAHRRIEKRYPPPLPASRGIPPEQLQKQSSNFLAKLEDKGLIGAGLTLHGLRVSFAAEVKRVTGANDDQVAAALGDRDTRMGRHYTRHVEQENKVALLFFSQKMGTGTEQDLENGRVQVFQIDGKCNGSNGLNDKGGR